MNPKKYIITDIIGIIAIGGKCPKCGDKFYLMKSGSCKKCGTPLVYFGIDKIDK